MKCLSVIILSMVLTTAYYANAKPLVSINADIPFPFPSGRSSAPIPVEVDGSKADSSKEVETLDKSESVFYGYYPYYGWPNYGYHYPLVYVG